MVGVVRAHVHGAGLGHGVVRPAQVVAGLGQQARDHAREHVELDAVRGASENASAGIYTEGPQEYVLQAVGRVRSAEEIGESVVAMRGTRSVLIRDVADVQEGAALRRGEGSRNGKPAVIVGVQKQPGANTIDVTERLDLELDARKRPCAVFSVQKDGRGLPHDWSDENEDLDDCYATDVAEEMLRVVHETQAQVLVIGLSVVTVR